MTSASTLKAIRLTHHFLGIFVAPAVLFFAFTGFLQMFSLHETTRGSSYVPPAIFVKLAGIHKKAALPQPKPPAPPKADKPDAPKPDKPAAAPAPTVKQSFHWPLKLFFGLVAIGLFTSTLTGLYMAWKYTRNKALVAAVFVAGAIIPLLCLPF